MVAAAGLPGSGPGGVNWAGVSNYWLGGTDNSDADRAEAAEVARLIPAASRMPAANRLFAAVAASWAVSQKTRRDGTTEPGVRQVIDIGCGFPPGPRTHELARSAREETRAAYVDSDPDVADLLDAVLDKEGYDGLAVSRADMLDPAAVLGDPAVRQVIRLGEPVLLLFAASLHHLDAGRAQQLVAAYAARVAAGSYVAVSAPRIDDEIAWRRLAGTRIWAGFRNWTPGEFAGVLGGLELVPPGVANALHLRPGWEDAPACATGPAYVLAGIGRTLPRV